MVLFGPLINNRKDNYTQNDKIIFITLKIVKFFMAEKFEGTIDLSWRIILIMCAEQEHV